VLLVDTHDAEIQESPAQNPVAIFGRLAALWNLSSISFGGNPHDMIFPAV
jgi:hypothetical protein